MEEKKMANLFEKMKQWNKEVSEKIEKREEK
ncbi:PspA/IM30 family protein, partial [Listeria monocytogenes]|nr:PspA/IM30 family protein [Listeria monocytogenes]